MSYVSAQEKLLFAGFSFTGSEFGLYPASYAMAQQSTPPGIDFDREFLRRLKANPTQFARVTPDPVGVIGKGNQISVALALDGEDVEYQKINDLTLGIFRIYATVLAFDRSSKLLLSAYPFSISYTMPVQGPLGRNGERAVFNKLFFTNEYQGLNVFDVWIDKFSKIKFNFVHSKK
jgi:hypothetical protein